MESLPNTSPSANKHEGYLQLIMGPMFSGKTSKLQSIYRQLQLCEVETLVVNYAEDTRYSRTELSTHDQMMIPCIFVSTLSELARDYASRLESARAVLINEGQFFEDVCEWTRIMVEEKEKKIYICGLDGDFRRNRFGHWLDLIPFADEIIKLKSICPVCKDGTPGLFSHWER